MRPLYRCGLAPQAPLYDFLFLVCSLDVAGNAIIIRIGRCRDSAKCKEHHPAFAGWCVRGASCRSERGDAHPNHRSLTLAVPRTLLSQDPEQIVQLRCALRGLLDFREEGADVLVLHHLLDGFPHRTAVRVEEREDIFGTRSSPNRLRVVLTLADAPAHPNRKIEVVVTRFEREFLQHLCCCVCEIVSTDVVSGVAHASIVTRMPQGSTTLTHKSFFLFLA